MTDRVRRKLPLLSPWITFRRRHDAIRPPSLATVIEPDLELVFTTLMNAQTQDARITAAQTRLDGIEAKINDALRAHIVDSIAEIRTAIGQFTPAQQPDFAAVSHDLAMAEAEATALRPMTAAAALDRARSGFAETAAGLLRQALDPAATAVGFERTEWITFVADIRTQLDAVIVEPDPERRIQRWNEANRRYLVDVIRHAQRRIDVLVQAQVPGTQAPLQTAASELAKAQVALVAGNLAGARTAYDAAMAAADQARPALQAAGGRLGGAADADAAAPNSGAALPPSILDAAIGSVLPMAVGRGVTIADVDRSLRRFTLGFAAVILALAILSGLQLLYAPNPAFGWADLSIAFLWGAGLHAIAGQSFQGLQSLAQQFR